MAEQAEHRRRSSPVTAAVIMACWLGAMGGLIALIPARALDPADVAFLATMGAVGLWRWGWGGLHLLRALVYLRHTFPMIRRRAEADPNVAGRHVGAVVLSWKMGDEMNAAVYGNLFRDILDNGGGGTVVAAVSSEHDMALIGHVHAMIDVKGEIRLAFTLQDGTGKRSAMADALARLREMGLPPDCPGILMDGDTLVAPGLIRATAPILLHQNAVGALTVDNTPLVAGRTIDREWYRLRMAQRHVTMSSMAMSGRVLVLTGRWSMFRSQILTDASFAANLLHDVVHHPRLGRIIMLTGDDKSSWRWVIEQGWEVTYVPDAVIYCLESLPGKGFVRDTIGLQKRWFGNMVRGGIKALAMGRARLGTFAWIALWDQRVSTWTPLLGLVFFGLAGVMHDPLFFLIFMLWVMLSRSVQAAMVGMISGRWHPAFAPLIYYGQIVGSGIKIFITFNPNVQKWTRQNTGGGDPAANVRGDSRVLMMASIACFISAIVLFSNLNDPSTRFDFSADRLAMEMIHGR